MADFSVGAPMDRIGVDIMGSLPLTAKGNRYLLVIVDYFTRWVEAFALPDEKAETVAESLVHEFLCRLGFALEIHSDQGLNFECTLFREICRLFEVHKTRTTPYRPCSNGLVERFNRMLTSLIRSYLIVREDDWDVHIPILTAAYCSNVHPSTGFSPNFLMLRREVATPADLVFPPSSGSGAPEEEPGYADGAVMLQCRSSRSEDVAERFEVRTIMGRSVCRTWVATVCIACQTRRRRYVLHHDRLKPYDSDLPKWAKRMQQEILKIGSLVRVAGRSRTVTPGSSS